MLASESTTNDSLALVNSFYGPGATACWYLTCLSCLASFILHPHKRHADAITNELIALGTFPTVASAHLITQVRSWPLNLLQDGEDILQKMWAFLAASLIIIETYFAFCIILILPNLFSRTPKRMCFLAATGIFCVFGEAYLYFALPEVRSSPGVFERSFIIDSLPLLVVVLLLAFSLVGLLFWYIFILVRMHCMKKDVEQLERVDPLEDDYGLASSDEEVGFIVFLSLPLMFISFSSTRLFPTWDLLSSKRTSWTGRRSFVDEFFSRTKASIMNLDQAMALLAGMTVLGFSLYSAAEAVYKEWWKREKATRERRNAYLRYRRGVTESHHRPLPIIPSTPGSNEFRGTIELQDWGTSMLPNQGTEV